MNYGKKKKKKKKKTYFEKKLDNNTMKKILILLTLITFLISCEEKKPTTTTTQNGGEVHKEIGFMVATTKLTEFEYKNHTYVSCEVRDGIALTHAGHCKCNPNK
jgi:hypothetical protein